MSFGHKNILYNRSNDFMFTHNNRLNEKKLLFECWSSSRVDPKSNALLYSYNKKIKLKKSSKLRKMRKNCIVQRWDKFTKMKTPKRFFTISDDSKSFVWVKIFQAKRFLCQNFLESENFLIPKKLSLTKNFECEKEFCQ